MAQPGKPAPRTLSLLARPVILATFCWTLIAAFGALPDRFARPCVEQDLVGQEDLWETIDPAGWPSAVRPAGQLADGKIPAKTQA